jgi:hypothetical protein
VVLGVVKSVQSPPLGFNRQRAVAVIWGWVVTRAVNHSQTGHCWWDGRAAGVGTIAEHSCYISLSPARHHSASSCLCLHDLSLRFVRDSPPCLFLSIIVAARPRVSPPGGSHAVVPAFFFEILVGLYLAGEPGFRSSTSHSPDKHQASSSDPPDIISRR